MGIITDRLDETAVLLARTERFVESQLSYEDYYLTTQAAALARHLVAREGGDLELIILATLLHAVDPTTAADFLATETYPPERITAVLALVSSSALPDSSPAAQIVHDAIHLASLISS